MELERPDSPDFGLLEAPLPPAAPEDDLLDRLREQTEFYFADSNLLRDAHLARLLTKSKKQFLFFRDLVRFRRIAHWLKEGGVPADKYFTTLAKALESSTVLSLGKLRNMVRRKSPFSFAPDNLRRLRDDKDYRTLYVDGFDRGLRQADIAEVFQQFGTIRSITLPLASSKDDTHENLGYCFVEFASHRSLTDCLSPAKSDHVLGHPRFRSHRYSVRFLSKAGWQANQDRLAHVDSSAEGKHSVPRRPW